MSAARRKEKKRPCQQGRKFHIGEHHERIRQHRVGHFRFQACARCDPVLRDVVRAVGIGRDIHARGSAAKPISRADLEAILKKLDDDQDEDFEWGKSITDLMKLLKLDSSLGARKQLAKELGYTGALDGSAEMNVWLHKQVMTKLAESGGKVPDSLKA